MPRAAVSEKLKINTLVKKRGAILPTSCSIDFTQRVSRIPNPPYFHETKHYPMTSELKLYKEIFAPVQKALLTYIFFSAYIDEKCIANHTEFAAGVLNDFTQGAFDILIKHINKEVKQFRSSHIIEIEPQWAIDSSLVTNTNIYGSKSRARGSSVAYSVPVNGIIRNLLGICGEDGVTYKTEILLGCSGVIVDKTLLSINIKVSYVALIDCDRYPASKIPERIQQLSLRNYILQEEIWKLHLLSEAERSKSSVEQPILQKVFKTPVQIKITKSEFHERLKILIKNKNEDNVIAKSRSDIDKYVEPKAERVAGIKRKAKEHEKMMLDLGGLKLTAQSAKERIARLEAQLIKANETISELKSSESKYRKIGITNMQKSSSEHSTKFFGFSEQSPKNKMTDFSNMAEGTKKIEETKDGLRTIREDPNENIEDSEVSQLSPDLTSLCRRFEDAPLSSQNASPDEEKPPTVDEIMEEEKSLGIQKSPTNRKLEFDQEYIKLQKTKTFRVPSKIPVDKKSSLVSRLEDSPISKKKKGMQKKKDEMLLYDNERKDSSSTEGRISQDLDQNVENYEEAEELLKYLQ